MLSNDLLSGAKEIGEFIGKTERQAFYLLEKNLIPGFKTGRIWNARKSTLSEHYARLEREAAERASAKAAGQAAA